MIALSEFSHFYTWPIPLKSGALKVWDFKVWCYQGFHSWFVWVFFFLFLNVDLLCVWKLFYIIPLSPCETSPSPGRYGPCPFNCNCMGSSWMSQPCVLSISGKGHLKLSLDDILASDIWWGLCGSQAIAGNSSSGSSIWRSRKSAQRF